MACQRKRGVALAVLVGFQGEPSCGQSIDDLNRHKTAVSLVTNPPKVSEVGLLQLSPGNDLSSVSTVDIRRTKRKPDHLRRCAKSRSLDIHIPTIEVLQFLEVWWAVVHIRTPVLVGRCGVDCDTACRSGNDIRICRFCRA